MIKRSVLLEFPYDENYSYGTDYIMNLEIARAGHKLDGVALRGEARRRQPRQGYQGEVLPLRPAPTPGQKAVFLEYMRMNRGS